MNSGVQSNVPVPSPLSINDAPNGSVEAVRTGMVESGSTAEIPIVNNISSGVYWFPITARNGD